MNSPTDDAGLTAQQLQQMRKRMEEILQNIRDQAELRKQCIEMAIRASPSDTTGAEIMVLAEKMLEFMTKPAQDVRVTIDPP